jgi:hypothetical protein
MSVQAVIAGQDFNDPGTAHLHDFNDTIVVKMVLRAKGKWILMGRVVITNLDQDEQYATAKLVHDANFVKDSVMVNIPHPGYDCLYLHAGFISNGDETITLECNTHNGLAWHGRIVAFSVDEIDFQ